MNHLRRKSFTVSLVLLMGFTIAVVNGRSCNMSALEDEPGVLVHLPSKLHFVIGPALKYGRDQRRSDILSLAASVTLEDREELRRVREQLGVDDNYEAVESFLDSYSMTKYAESARLYYLLHVIDTVLGEVPSVKRTKDQVARDYVKDLARCGSPRLAARRMWAARWFVENTPIPQDAIPALKRACDDESLHVRVWAHGAIAIVDGHAEEHVLAIEAIVAQVPPTDERAMFIANDSKRVIDIVRPRIRDVK